jgi:transcriptional regulator with XRE-family HTH domain
VKTLGDQIKAARLAAGMTQQQLAFALRSEQGTVSRWELGKTQPSRKTVQRILAALGMK